MSEHETQSSDRLHHIDAVHFVHHAIKHAMRDPAAQAAGKVTGEGLCRILLELSVDEFGAEGKDVLTGWNLEASEDVRLIVSRMLEAEVEEASSVDMTSNFESLFNLKQPPDRWALRWE